MTNAAVNPSLPRPELPLLSIVVPCYNEAQGLHSFLDRLFAAIDRLPDCKAEVLCIDDGSRDQTATLLLARARQDSRLKVLELSRNFGKEAALSAGLDACRGDAVVPMDADLQHPPELLAELVARWRQGFDVVLARRSSRVDQGLIQRTVSRGFYRVMNRLAEHEIPPEVGDFRLMDRCVVDALCAMPERRRFMKGLFAWVGFTTTTVDFDVAPRQSGQSHFRPRALWTLALEGITSFSTAPLRIWSWVGMTLAMLALLYGSWIVIKTLWWGVDVPGYASLLTAVLFLGGVQLISIGVLGEYLGRIYAEVKQRPLYIVRRRHGFDALE